MKTAMMSCLLFLGAMTLSQASLADTGSRTVEVRVTDAIVPGGFDSNTDAYVIEVGLFPNGCYKWAYAETTNLPGNITEIRSYATVASGMCPMVIVPFHREVQLGKLASGTHLIRFINSDGTYLEEQMDIE